MESKFDFVTFYLTGNGHCGRSQISQFLELENSQLVEEMIADCGAEHVQSPDAFDEWCEAFDEWCEAFVVCSERLDFIWAP